MNYCLCVIGRLYVVQVDYLKEVIDISHISHLSIIIIYHSLLRLPFPTHNIQPFHPPTIDLISLPQHPPHPQPSAAA
jgi:hypothetical protein